MDLDGNGTLSKSEFIIGGMLSIFKTSSVRNPIGDSEQGYPREHFLAITSGTVLVFCMLKEFLISESIPKARVSRG